MAIYVKLLAFMLCLYVISAMPVDDQQEDFQSDLVAIEDTLQDDDAVSGEELTRSKRNREYHHRNCYVLKTRGK